MILTKCCRKISNIYMLPKLHKSQEIRTKYIQIDKDILIEGRPIVADPVHAS